MGIHHVQRHLHGVEVEASLGRDIQHLEVDARILVAREADVSDLPGLLRCRESLHGTAFAEDAVRVVVAEDLVVLHEVDAIGAEALQRCVDLVRGFGFAAAVHLGHEIDFVAVIALVESDTHAQLAAALVVIPAIIHERDAAIRSPDA